MGVFKRPRNAPPSRRLRQMLLAVSLVLSVCICLYQIVLMSGSSNDVQRRRNGGIVQIDSRIYFVDDDDDESGDNNGDEGEPKSNKADANADGERDNEEALKKRAETEALLAAQGKPLNTLPRQRRKKKEQKLRSHAGRRRAATTARPGVRVRNWAAPHGSPRDEVCRLYQHFDLPASNNSGPQFTYRYRHMRVIRAPDDQHLCDKETQVFAAINSGVFNFERRNAMRETWVSWFRSDVMMRKIMRIVFIVGVPESFTNRTEYAAFQRQMSDEINRYGDVLLVDVADTYMNITQKVLAMYSFVLTAPQCTSERAPRLRYVFKADDDVFVHPTNFVKRLGELDDIRDEHTPTFLYGAAISNAGPMRKQWPEEEGDTCSMCKWYVPEYVWPSGAWGFSYAAGCGFWQTIEALRAVHTAALCSHVLFIDDVYLAGLLPARLGIRLFPGRDMFDQHAHRVAFEQAENSLVTCNLEPAAVRSVWARAHSAIVFRRSQNRLGLPLQLDVAYND